MLLLFTEYLITERLFSRYYCNKRGLTEPQAFCLPGYYCNGSIGNPQTNICPVGHYCPEGVERPVACPPGSFSNAIGNKNLSQCNPCSRGKWCDPSDKLFIERDCDAGYICVRGTSTFGISYKTESNLLDKRVE